MYNKPDKAAKKKRQSVKENNRDHFRRKLIKKPDSNVLDKIKKMVETRTRFEYTFCDVLISVLCCLSWFPSRKHKKFAKGERRVTHELDISRLILMLRNLKVLTRVTLNDA